MWCPNTDQRAMIGKESAVRQVNEVNSMWCPNTDQRAVIGKESAVRQG